jgi:curved DNA-binding protein CbpA
MLDRESDLLNLYDVLGVNSECTRSDIKNAYRNLVKKHHPDRGGNPELFELITKAFNILANPNTREEYDEMTKLIQQAENDHFKLKQSAEDFIKAQEASKTELKEKDAEKDFKRTNIELDKKHDFNREQLDIKLNSEETDQRLNDMKMIFEQQNIENTPDRIFAPGEAFNNKKFQSAFRLMNKQKNQMTVHTGNPLAYDVGTAHGVSFSSLDNIDKIYDEDDNSTVINSLFGSAKFENTKVKSQKINIADLSDDENVENHKTIDDEYNKSLEQRMREREMETHKLSQRTMADFDTDPTMGGHSILYPAGITDKKIQWEDDKAELKQKYDRLLELRKKL